MRATIATILSLFWVVFGFSQDEKPKKEQVVDGYVISATGSGILGGTMSRYDNFGTQWKGGAGISSTFGLGFQLRYKFKWAVELDAAYEIAQYRYSHINLVRDIKLGLGYQVPYASLKGTYFFKTDNPRDDRKYVKLGAAYMFTNGNTSSNEEPDHLYTSSLADSPTLFLYGEYGWMRDFGDNLTLSYGITYRYALNDVITNRMRANNELNSAVGFSRGNYIGFVVKFAYPLKSWKATPKTGRDKDENVRIKI